MIMIVFSSIQLSVDSYNNYENIENNSEFNSTLIKLFNILNFIYGGIFLIEAVLKIISNGLIWDSTSYLRDSWNILDFTVVLISLLEIFVEIRSHTN